MEKLGSNRNGQRGCGQARRARVAQAGQAAEGPGAERQEEAAEDRDQLEGDVVGDERVEDDGDQAGKREVEGVEGEAVVPARVPPGQLAVGQQVRFEERRQGDVGPGVAPGRGGVEEQQVRVQLASAPPP